jgi:hypothetical protein
MEFKMNDLSIINSLADKFGPAAILLLAYLGRERHKSRKFVYSGALMEEMEERLTKKIDAINIKLATSNAINCGFSEVFQGHLKCIHDITANEKLTKDELIDALDENILQTMRLLKNFKDLDNK